MSDPLRGLPPGTRLDLYRGRYGGVKIVQTCEVCAREFRVAASHARNYYQKYGHLPRFCGAVCVQAHRRAQREMGACATPNQMENNVQRADHLPGRRPAGATTSDRCDRQ